MGDKMGNNIRGGLEPRGSLSSADGNIPRGKRGSRRGFRAALGLIVSTMLATASTVGAGVLPAQAAEEVGDWVCDTRDYRVTDFQLSDGTAAEFTIPKFGSTGLPGTFKSVEIRQGAKLKAWGSLGFFHSLEKPGPVKYSANYAIWTNLPPAAPESFPTGDSTKEIYDEFTQLLYENPNQVGGGTRDNPGTWVEVPETISELSATSTSTDGSAWGGVGSHDVVMQTLTSMQLVGAGGNVKYSQTTLAAAEVCYRYTYELPDPKPKIDLSKNVEGDDVTEVAAGTHPVKVVFTNRGTEALKGLVFTDTTNSGNDVVWNADQIAALKDLVLEVGKSVTIDGTVEVAVGETHKDTASITGTGVVSGVKVSDEDPTTLVPPAPEPKVSIGDYVWFDTDRDGQQDGDEPGVPNVLVKLFEKDGTTPVQTATTNAQGYYAFKDLQPGAEYRVEFVKPDGSSFTLRNEGDDKTDSDPNAAGIVNVTAPSKGKNLTDPGKADDSTIDAGLVKDNLVLKKTLVSEGKVHQGSTVEFALTPSNDGPVDALAGWSVTDLLPEGMTLVSMSGEGYTCSGATCVASAPLKAGATAKPITVKATVDTKFVGDLINVAYVAPSDKDIDETNPLVVPTGQTKDTEPTNTATSPTDNDASAPVTTDSLVSIGDYVWTDVNRDGVQDAAEPAVKGVVVNLYEADGVTLIGTTKTDDKGFYSFIDLTPGREYVVEFVKPEGYAFADDNAGDSDIVDSDADRVTGRVKIVAPASGVNSETDPDDPTIDAGLVKFNLRITKKLLTAGKVHEGDTVKFSLLPHNDGPADALGGWSVTDLLPVGLTLVSMEGESYTCDNDTATCLSEAPLAAGADGGLITVTATVNSKFVGTVRNITYVSPAPGDVDETNPLEVPTKETDTTKSPTDNDDEASLTVDSLVSIGDYVWLDVDRDGVQDKDEAPIKGMTVNLYDADGETLLATTKTDEKGFYSFTDLIPGKKYVVEFVKGDKQSFTSRNSGSDAAADSDADVKTGRVTVTAPQSGSNSATDPDDPTIDAGIVEFNLSITKDLVTKGKVRVGDTVEFTLVAHNDGPVNALAGWSVSDLLPAGLELVSMSGDGYDCDLDTVTCVADEGLAVGADGSVVTLKAKVTDKAEGTLRNIAYVSPSDDDIDETNPLVVPDKDTDTKKSETDNDDEAKLRITPENPGLPSTGSSLPDGLIGGSLGLVLLGAVVMIVVRRRSIKAEPTWLFGVDTGE